jgi:hypothetical protein
LAATGGPTGGGPPHVGVQSFVVFALGVTIFEMTMNAPAATTSATTRIVSSLACEVVLTGGRAAAGAW